MQLKSGIAYLCSDSKTEWYVNLESKNELAQYVVLEVLVKTEL